jgi:hydrogenase/urease accessory protein HupE
MRRVEAVVFAVWEFVVGDDWRTALGVVLALGLTAAIAQAGVPAWWVVPVAVVALLALSIRRAMRLR